MFRSTLLIALCATQAYGQLTLGSNQFPVTTIVPINDFSIVLTFSETVQKSSSVQLTVEDNAATANAPDAKKFSMGCSSPTAKWFNKVVLVPISKSGGLKGGTFMKATVPSNCFKAYRASSTTDVWMNADSTFSFTTEATDICTNTNGGTPILVTEKSVGGSSIPYSPANGAWLSSPGSTKFELYFSESLTAGEGLVSVSETTGSRALSTIDYWSGTDSKVSFDDGSIKGKVEIKKGSDWFKPGAKYGLTLAASAFKDALNNPTGAYFAGNYHVKVSTTLTFSFPANGCCKDSVVGQGARDECCT
jgi:hypothetical protein